MKKIYDVVHSRKYTDKNGEEKTKYTNNGSVFQRDDGKLCMVDQNGTWFNFYVPKDDKQKPQKPQRPINNDILVEDLPFR